MTVLETTETTTTETTEEVTPEATPTETPPAGLLTGDPPPSLDQYTLPEGLTAESAVSPLMVAIQTEAHRAGMSVDDWKTMAGVANTAASQVLEGFDPRPDREAKSAENLKALQEEYGAGFNSAKGLAIKAFNDAAKKYPEIVKEVEDNGLADNPGLFRLFHDLGKRSANDTTPRSDVPVATVETRVARYKTLAMSEAYNNSSHIEHEVARREYKQIIDSLIEDGVLK